jgi:hypothetical protein
MSQETTLLSIACNVLPWLLVFLGAVVLVIGLTWRSLTDSDTANGALVGAGVLCVALGFAISCARPMPEKQTEETAKEQEAQPVKNMGSGAEFNQVRLPLVAM